MFAWGSLCGSREQSWGASEEVNVGLLMGKGRGLLWTSRLGAKGCCTSAGGGAGLSAAGLGRKADAGSTGATDGKRLRTRLWQDACVVSYGGAACAKRLGDELHEARASTPGVAQMLLSTLLSAGLHNAWWLGEAVEGAWFGLA